MANAGHTWDSTVELLLVGGQAAVEETLTALQAAFGDRLTVASGPGSQEGESLDWEARVLLTVTQPAGADAVNFWNEQTATDPPSP